MKILICFGTRPEAIKMAPVYHELKKRKVEVMVCVTAQHREMLDQVLDFFEIVPHYDLDLMVQGQTLNYLSAGILQGMEDILRKEKFDLVLVHGDTTTSALVALAAFHLRVKVGHVEAGLRTYNKTSPFPEEVNRQITSKIADFHFTPTNNATCNLLKEQIDNEGILQTGNTVVDSLKWAGEKMKTLPLLSEVQNLLPNLDLDKELILVTGHRRENFGPGIEEICNALLEISELIEVEIVFPVHLNPKVQVSVQKILENKKNIHLVNPFSYPMMLWVMERCNLIISDSGGVQEEAPHFKKPVLVTRTVSERMEGVDSGFSFLVGTSKERIVFEALRLLKNPPKYGNKPNPYGDGIAAQRIVDFLLI